MNNTIQMLASYSPKGKEQKAMKQQLVIVIVICITMLAVTLIARKDLCEIRIRSGQTEVAAFTAYESR
ncbi:protein HokC/D [Enterobacillus tribolii]|uniref:Protein HokC/D n=1 Tax=Enterobacillus tribolii TaxID=1487935 RepID=A0A370QS11_9GAMM|nr:type I toxin-antitoxin system Hok family toxin [Enterobacillus tribolii]RDK92047.1 protein HokC/D [Enterobacillus tribolii]